MLKLKDKVAIITGAGQGIGLTYARCLASEGAKVVIADVIDCNAVSRKLMNEIPNSDIFAIKVDVSDENSTEKMVQDTFKRYGRIDILVNNAAIFGKLVPGPFEEIKVSEWDQLMAVNVKGPWLCSKAVSPIMRKQKSGKIINIASGTLFKGTPNLLHYVSSKGAIVTMTRCLSRELGDDKICVNTIAPGLTMSENVLKSERHMEMRDSNMATRAIKRYQTPDDLNGALLFLSSDDSDFVTGQCLIVDGGSANN